MNSDEISKLEQLRRVLRTLCEKVEEQEIENRVYFDAILEVGKINFHELKARVQDAQKDQTIRQEVREQFSGMWQAIETAGTEAFYEELLNSLPTPERLT